MKKVLIVLLVLAVVVGGGLLLYRHFVADRVSDWGGMENPEYAEQARLPENNERTAPASSVVQEEDNGTV